MKMKLVLGSVVSFLIALSCDTVANAYTFRIDSFKIIKNGSLLFEDGFTDGSPPPSAPNLIGGNPISYSVRGTLGPETGSKLTFDTSGAIATPPVVGVQGFLDQRATLLTNIDPNNLVLGLKIDDTFFVTGVFDLLVPGPRRELYGIRLTDFGNDNLELVVRRTAAGELRVQLRRLDDELDTVTTIASVPVDQLHEQIALTLSRPSTANNNIVASFTYIDRGVTGPVTTLPSTAAIFRGENFTRAGFIARTPFFPGPLRATVGNQAVYLNWDPPPISVDGYNIFAERFDDNTKQFVSLGTVNPPGILIRNTSFRVFGFANGQPVENGKLYRFTVQAVDNGVLSGLSNAVLGRPGRFSGQFGIGVSEPPSPPDNPILFLHGICLPGLGPTTASTWETTVDFFENTLAWTSGGTLQYFETQDPRISSPLFFNFRQHGNFYTVTFGNCQANYPDRRGLLHQANEVKGFIRAIRARGESRKFIIVAHSMGGMAARSYIADNPQEAVQEIKQFITYGTPHWGALFTSGFQLISDGARDLDYDCTNGRLDYTGSPFFEHLRRTILPSAINRYSFIRGAVLYPQTLAPCLSKAHDGVIPTDSADLGRIPQAAPLGQYPLVLNPDSPLTTDRFHDEQTSDFPSMLCILDPTRSCLTINVMSPVDIEVVAPDGRSIAVDLVEIPGASYMQPIDDTGHSTATVVIPFPTPGNYAINVLPKPEASSTDTYSLEVSRDGTTTVLAQNQQIRDIPSAGYAVDVPLQLKIDIKPKDFPNTIQPKSRGRISVAILSTRSLDAYSRVNRLSLTFGHTGDEVSLDSCSREREDVNRDGLRDLVCHFRTERTDFKIGDIEGVLKGQTVDGLPLFGKDSVRIVGAKESEREESKSDDDNRHDRH